MSQIPLFKVHMPTEVTPLLGEVLHSGFIGQGEKVKKFEESLQLWIGSKNIVTVNSCTSAIHLALRLAGVGNGDEVISTPMTCTATNMPILERGGRIVWSDIDPKTGCIDVSDVKRKITSKTKVIICTHWAGYPCDIAELNDIAHKNGCLVIEDAAHAFGAKYKNEFLGFHSDFVCFSFQAIKHITTGDGGVLVCKSDESFRRAKLLRWYGIDRDSPRTAFRCEDDITEYGYKFHMNDISATIGLSQVKYVDDILKKHRFNAEFYRQSFCSLGEKGFSLHSYEKDRLSSFWVYPVFVKNKTGFIDFMLKNNIVVSGVHKRNDVHSVFSSFRKEELLGVSEFERNHVSIPVGWWIGESEREFISNKVLEFCSQ